MAPFPFSFFPPIYYYKSLFLLKYPKYLEIEKILKKPEINKQIRVKILLIIYEKELQGSANFSTQLGCAF